MVHLILALSLAVGSAGAAPPSDPDIVIQGVRNRDKAIRDFIGAVTPAPVGGQLSRFELKACPAAVGLPEEQNRQVVVRLRLVASAVDMPLGPEKCAPNVLVIAVDDKEEFIKAFQRKYPAYFTTSFGDMMPTPREKGPAVAWHIGGLLTADHLPAARASRAQGGYSVVSTTDASRLLPASIPHFLGGVLVVERKALAGLTTRQFADYAALRLYARTNPAKLKPSAESILGALDTSIGSVPPSMTSWDFEFLKGLYHSEDRQFATQQRGDIEYNVRRNSH